MSSLALTAPQETLCPEPEPIPGRAPAELGLLTDPARQCGRLFGRGLSDFQKDKQSGAAQKLRIDRLPPEASQRPERPLWARQAACSGQRPQG